MVRSSAGAPTGMERGLTGAVVTAGGGCGRVTAATASESFPQLQGITPRPEPDYNDEEAWHQWNEEYQLWGRVKCPCRTGYFCREHGEWISGAEIKSGEAPSQDHEFDYNCPPRHYQDFVGHISHSQPARNVRKSKCMCSDPCPTSREDRARLQFSSSVGHRRVSQSASEEPNYGNTERQDPRREEQHSSESPSKREGKRREADYSYASTSHQETMTNLPGPSTTEPSYYTSSPSSSYPDDYLYGTTNEGYRDEYSQTASSDYSYPEQQMRDQDYSYGSPHDFPPSSLQQSSTNYYNHDDDEHQFHQTWVDDPYGAPGSLDYVAEDLNRLDLGSSAGQTPQKNERPQIQPDIKESNVPSTGKSRRSSHRHSKEHRTSADDGKSSGSKTSKHRSSKESSKSKSRDKR